MLIILDKDKCISCGTCWALCPRFFEEKNGKGHLKESKQEGSNEVRKVKSAECVKDAVEVCSVGAIKINA